MGMVLYGIVVILVCMQDEDENEESTGLVGRIRERIHDWGFRNPWIARPLWYFVLLVGVLVVCYVAFNYFNLHHTDADSARYMLSAMVQAQAAIIAIVITLTLIAVQLTASAYSPRVIRIFKNNPDMWILLAIYGVSMLYGLIVLKMVEGAAGDVVSQDVFWFRGFVPVSFECCVSLAYWSGAFTLIALFPYMLNIIGLLEAETIIQRLAIKITKDEIIDPKKDDPIQPIMDIIHGSVVKYDIATTRVGLKEVTDRVIEIIDSDIEEKISSSKMDTDLSIEVVKNLYSFWKISGSFCDHLGRVGRLTASNRDADSAIEVVTNLYSFWKSTTANQFEDAASQAVKALKLFGKDAIDHKFEFAARYTIKRLECVGIDAARNGDAVATKQAAWSLGQLGMAAARTKIEIVAQDAVKHIECVGKCAAKNQLKDAISQAVASLGNVGTSAVEKGFEDVVWQVRDSLELVEMDAKDNNLTIATRQKVESLKRFGETVAGKGEVFETVIIQMVGYIRDVGGSAAKDGDKELTKHVVESLVYVGKTTVEQKLKGATEEVARSIGLVGMDAAKKGQVFRDATKRVIACLQLHQIHITESTGGVEFFKTATKCTAQSFIRVGVFAIVNNLDDIVEGCANCFVGWTKSWERSEIDDLFIEWATSEHYEFSLEFKKRCEELRTRNQ